jgi:hypothetical protein
MTLFLSEKESTKRMKTKINEHRANLTNAGRWKHFRKIRDEKYERASLYVKNIIKVIKGKEISADQGALASM